MYAKNTSVPIERTKAEIEKLVQKHKAEQFVSGWDANGANVGFKMQNRNLRFYLPLVKAGNFRKWDRETNKYLGENYSNEKAAQVNRARWRALLLVLKAKLESVECGITDFETEFLGNVMVGGGKTVADMVKPGIADLYAGGGQLALPPGLGG